MKLGEIGSKPVEYLVLAWIAGVGSAVLLAGLIAPIVVAYSGEFDGPLWQQALVGLLIVPLVMMTQFIVAFAFCAAILHSRSQRTPTGQAIGTGHQNTNIIVRLPFETTAWSRFWVAVHHSGWRVSLAIYAVILALVVTSAEHNYLLGVVLVAAAVALGFWHASAVKRKSRSAAAAVVDEQATQERYEKGLAARERKVARDLEAAKTKPLTDDWIDAELRKALGKRAMAEVQKGDLTRLDDLVGRAHAALAGRVPAGELRTRALELAKLP